MRACRSPGRCPLVALSQQLAPSRRERRLADGEGDAAVADLVCAGGDDRGDPDCIQGDDADLGHARGDDADPVCTRGDDADPVCTRGDVADPMCTHGDDADPVCTRGDDAPPCSDIQKSHDVFLTDTSGILHVTTDWSSREELFH